MTMATAPRYVDNLHQSIGDSSVEQSLQSVLQSNLELQARIAHRLQSISNRKADNRRRADRILQQWSRRIHCRPEPDGYAQASKERYRYNPYRKWHRYFVCGPEDRPNLNDDTKKRRKLEDTTFFHHISPPWSNREIAWLSDTARQEEVNESSSGSVDFEKVSEKLEQLSKKNRVRLGRPRTPHDCQIQYQQMTAQQRVFTKQESLKIVEQHHLHSASSPQGWLQKAVETLEPRPTPRQVLTQFHKTRLNEASWTRHQDEVLLKYAAAMGPQWVLDVDSASSVPLSKSPKQILLRANQSLVNPNWQKQSWSESEERKLVLLQKVYKDNPSSSVIPSHFDRAPKSVREKWQRSLTPQYTQEPFTPQEDQLLLQSVTPRSKWVDIARHQFADRRHPQRLQNRWMELASDEAILEKIQSKDHAHLNLSDDFVVVPRKEESTTADNS